MKITVPTNHNYHCERPIRFENLSKEQEAIELTKGVIAERWTKRFEVGDEFKNNKKQIDRRKTNTIEETVKKILSDSFELKADDESLSQLKIFRFKPVKDDLGDDEELILKLFKKKNLAGKDDYFIQTGLFAGVVYRNGCEFNITCAYGDEFLHRMLNFLNNIYIDNTETTATNSNNANSFQHILCYLFIHTLGRASALGLPKTYQQKQLHDYKMRGTLDMNAYIKKDIPFMGKISSRYRELDEIQPIIDILYLACEKLKKTFSVDALKPILNIYQQLKSQFSGKYFNQLTLQKAKNHTALNNPMFAQFRQTLEYAEIILNDFDLKSQKDAKQETYGYLFDISQLFEIYIEKLLAKDLHGWTVTSQEELPLYENRFYKRHMRPDIVLKNGEKVIVFDAKFKKMRFNYLDLDRSDFYQIHTYMHYYGENLLFGGLIYPLSNEHKIENSYSDTLFDLADKTGSPRFIVDGIELKDLDDKLNSEDKIQYIPEKEQTFITRIKNLIEIVK